MELTPLFESVLKSSLREAVKGSKPVDVDSFDLKKTPGAIKVLKAFGKELEFEVERSLVDPSGDYAGEVFERNYDHLERNERYSFYFNWHRDWGYKPTDKVVDAFRDRYKYLKNKLDKLTKWDFKKECWVEGADIQGLFEKNKKLLKQYLSTVEGGKLRTTNLLFTIYGGEISEKVKAAVNNRPISVSLRAVWEDIIKEHPELGKDLKYDSLSFNNFGIRLALKQAN